MEQLEKEIKEILESTPSEERKNFELLDKIIDAYNRQIKAISEEETKSKNGGSGEI